MKTYFAIFLGTPESMERSGWSSLHEDQRKERQRAGMEAWEKWIQTYEESILDIGTPLGKTKRVSSGGIEDTSNAMTAYSVVRAPSHEAAARLFEGHPHFTIFPGESIEIMECLPIPRL